MPSPTAGMCGSDTRSLNGALLYASVPFALHDGSESHARTRALNRDPRWTEAIAVGDEEYVRDIADRVRGRASLLLAEADDGAWTVRDSEGSCVHDGLGGAVLLRSDFGWPEIDSRESSGRIGG